MSEMSLSISETPQNIRPASWLDQLSSSQASGRLQVNRLGFWTFYVRLGKIIYATHSLEPFDRLERHLRYLSYQIPALNSTLRTQVRLNFEKEDVAQPTESHDYQAICWLVKQNHLSQADAETLIKRITLEVTEAFLLLPDCQAKFISQYDQTPELCMLEPQWLMEVCQTRLASWKRLCPQIASPYQRPYFVSQVQAQQKISPEQQQKLGNILRGFSIRHLATLLNQDELTLARSLHPHIADGTILLREPQPPFDQWPKFSHYSDESITAAAAPAINLESKPGLANIANDSFTQKSYKIACVDDSPAVLKEINRFLNDQQFAVFLINDSVKALMEIIRIKPDLILLDVGMPTVDGYKLCRLIRNHSLFKTTPIVMVTGHTGIIDRTKARLAGATDYLTKPFNQTDLLKIAFRYLSA